MADNQIQHRVRIAVRLRRVTPKNIKDSAPVVQTSRRLTITVVRCFPARIGQAFNLVAFCKIHHPKIRIAVSTPNFKIVTCSLQTTRHPVLPMKLFVLSICSLNEYASANSLTATFVNGKDRCVCHLSTARFAQSIMRLYPILAWGANLLRQDWARRWMRWIFPTLTYSPPRDTLSPP